MDEAVFGHKYHQQLSECKSIFQRLRLSPSERLETYVREHSIIDIQVEDTDHNKDDDDDNSDENEGNDLDENTFPDAGVFDQRQWWCQRRQWWQKRQCQP